MLHASFPRVSIRAKPFRSSHSSPAPAAAAPAAARSALSALPSPHRHRLHAQAIRVSPSSSSSSPRNSSTEFSPSSLQRLSVSSLASTSSDSSAPSLATPTSVASSSTTTTTSSSSSSRPLLTLGESTLLDVSFPPYGESDFVIHFQYMRFHCHRAVLEAHAPNFLRMAREQSGVGLQDEETARRDSRPAAKRRKRAHSASAAASASSTNKPRTDCSDCRLPLGSCVQLPDALPAVEAMDYQDLYVFLKHVYYVTTYCVPPFVPASVGSAFVVHETPPGPTALHSAAAESLPASQLLCDDSGLVLLFASIMACAHYAGSTAVLSRCEQVMMARLRADEDQQCAAWLYLVHAVRYGMQQLSSLCMDLLTEWDAIVDEEAEWRQADGVAEQSRETMLDLFQLAVSKYRAERRRNEDNIAPTLPPIA